MLMDVILLGWFIGLSLLVIGLVS